MRKGERYHYEICCDKTAELMFGIRSGSGVEVRRISTDFGEMNRLVGRCNRLQVSPVHLLDIVEDFQRG